MKLVTSTLTVAILLSWSAMPLHAAELILEEQLGEVRNALAQLDQLAKTCLDDAAQQSATTATTSSCAEFSAALDGDLLLNYLQRCNDLANWRDDFIEAYQQNQLSEAESTTSLRNLVQIQLLCGDNAVAQRTTHVALAYARLISAPFPGLSNDRAGNANDRLDTIQQQYLIERERLRLRDSRDAIQQRQSVETQRQFDQLQLELLRQGILPR